MNASTQVKALSFQVTLDELTRPIEQAFPLVNQFYTEPSLFRYEWESIGEQCWQVVATEAQIAKPGDILPLTVAGFPILLTRDAQGQLHAFHNACKHRGAVLATEKSQQKASIVCPYHAWRYALDGRLICASHFNGLRDHRIQSLNPRLQNQKISVLKEEIVGRERQDQEIKNGEEVEGLTPIRVDQWHQLIFINLGSKAPPLSEVMQPINQRWQAYPLSQMKYGGGLNYKLHANWKLIVENFIDSYHNPFVHPSLNKASPWGEHYSIVEDSYFGVGTRLYDANLVGHSGLNKFNGLPNSLHKSAEYLHLFPNLMMGLHADYLFVFTVNPIDVSTTEENIWFFFAPASSTDENHTQAKEQAIKNWDRVNREDIPIVEGMHRVRTSSTFTSTAFNGGCFSPFHEKTLQAFQQKWAKTMLNKTNN